MSDLLVEVDEALKQEKLEKIWQQYGGFFIGFLMAIILGTAANAGYHNWKDSKNHAQSALYLDATADPNFAAEDLHKIAPQLHGGLYYLTELQAAGLAAKQGNTADAVATYERISTDKNANKTFRDLAGYMLVVVSKDMDAKDKLARLNTITNDEQNTWRYQAHLQAALINAVELNDFTEARMHLSHISKGVNIPDSLKQKAKSLDIIYALKAKK